MVKWGLLRLQWLGHQKLLVDALALGFVLSQGVHGLNPES